MKNLCLKRLFLDYLPMTITAISIVSMGIYEHTPFISVLPTLISIVILSLVAKINRLGLLIGALNCWLYAFTFFMQGVYGSLAACLLFDFPFQMVSFFLWKKNSFNHKLFIRKMNKKNWILFISFSVFAWIISYIVYKYLKTASLILNTTLFVLVLMKYILMMFRFMENNFIGLIYSFLNIALWIHMTIINPKNIVYVVSAMYSTYMTIVGVVNWIKLYSSQNNPKNDYESQK